MSQLPDRIAETFNGSTVFITGATGFLGKAIVEKLLRATNVNKLYLLIRRKKGKSPSERIQEMFNNELFKTLLKQQPDAAKKCVPIFGSVSELGLGMTTKDREAVTKETNFIFHSAASTRFDDSLRDAILMNTRGTQLLLELAEQCKQLKLFIHVSTAFVCPNEDVTFEKPYEPPADPHEVLHSINWIKEDTMGNFTKTLLGETPNSYTFSKALAEALVNEKVGKLPIIITRPAVVIPSYRDPFPGWFNNLQGPMGLFVGAGKGVLRSMYMDSQGYANLTPVDCTIAAMLVASWNFLTTKNAPYIYNLCVPETDFKMNWCEILEAGYYIISEKVPFNGIMWYPGGALTKNRTYHRINFILFQLLPAIILDFLLLLLGYKPILFDIQMRISKAGEMFEFYTTKAWHFSTNNVENMRQKLNEKEKAIYILQSDNIDINEFLEHSILYARRYILKETDEMLPVAKRNMKIMFVLDRFLKAAFFVALFYYIYNLILMPALNMRKRSLN